MSKARNLSDFISDASIDATEIADGAVTAAKLHTSLDLSSKTVTFADDHISGNKIHGGGNGTNALQFIIEPNGTSTYTANQGAIFPWDVTNQIPNAGSGTHDPDVSDGNWHHCAFVKQGTELRDYFDGTLYITRTVSASAVWDQTAGSNFVHIGAITGQTSGRAKGWLDDFRISKRAVYTGSSYTVPTKSFKKR